jgi:hypothetical protein
VRTITYGAAASLDGFIARLDHSVDTSIPLLPQGERQIDLELVECRATKQGCVYARYRIVSGK